MADAKTVKTEAEALKNEILAEAKAEAAKILEKAMAEAEGAKARKAKNRDVEKRMAEKVTVKLFKDNGKYKDDVFVAVNGERYQIQRGVPVTVPRYIAAVLEESMRQDEQTASLIRQKVRDTL